MQTRGAMVAGGTPATLAAAAATITTAVTRLMMLVARVVVATHPPPIPQLLAQPAKMVTGILIATVMAAAGTPPTHGAVDPMTGACQLPQTTSAAPAVEATTEIEKACCKIEFIFTLKKWFS